MKKLFLFFVVFNFSFFVYAQNVIRLPFEKSDEVTWKNKEKEYYSQLWQTQVITNVSVPTMQVFKPSRETNTGTAVVIAPGGGLHALSIESEGNEVAKWLVKRGITAFVLKYRLVPTGEDGVAELTNLSGNDFAKMMGKVAKVIPLSTADALHAVTYVREHAKAFEIDPEKIGVMGFSAGGAVAMGAAYNYTKENRPDFLVFVYPWTAAMPVRKPQKDSPPLLIVCASDDPLGLASGAVELYNSWYGERLSTALHMYSKGGHGFGMRKKGLPSDTWIERFYDWSVAEGLTVEKK